MFTWHEGATFPFHAKAGDVLFLAGRSPANPNVKLPYEHVAIVGESREIKDEESLLRLPIFGTPEFGMMNSSTEHSFADGNFILRNFREAGNTLGSDKTCWNIVARVNFGSKDFSRDIEMMLPIYLGTMNPIGDGKNFVVYNELRGGIDTNCLGFVCSILSYFYDTEIFDLPFPSYPSPYRLTHDDRDYPSPGHLAKLAFEHVLMNSPWAPKNYNEATEYSRVDRIWEDF
jgi:hypothetical protein